MAVLRGITESTSWRPDSAAARQSMAASLALLGGGAVVNPPIRMLDWPLPARRSLFQASHVASASLPISAERTFPSRPQSWPLPTRTPSRVPESLLIGVLTFRTVAVAPRPFASYDWPLASLGGRFSSMRQLDARLGSPAEVAPGPPSFFGNEYRYFALRKHRR